MVRGKIKIRNKKLFMVSGRRRWGALFAFVKKVLDVFVVVLRVYVSMSLYRFLILSYYLLNFD